MMAGKIVLGSYASYVQVAMEALRNTYHPECKITANGNHALSCVYIGFDAFQEGILSKLNTAWPGFNLEIQKGVSNETDVVVDAVEGSASHEWVDITSHGYREAPAQC